ncbi:hypothetical protein EYC84_008439 [Monilinia fructicola]|uniref:ubiquitinyl hydrolase 1 n=1 Tax=Monilinia fructicola TaxID=38448 RepID=A0A5M9JF62_MONFR|nr:hypothetical protein EYC84_008439 [Monilinia fructicola]
MNPQNRRMHDLFDRDQFSVDDYHQDYQEGLYQKEPIRLEVILSVLAIVTALVYQSLISLDYDLLPFPQLAWNALVYITPTSLIDFADNYSNPLHIRNPNMYPQTLAQKSEAMRRIFGIETSGGIIDSVANAGRRRLSILPLIGLGAAGGQETPAGLGNWDNSCYQNSILQGLASLDSLPDFLESFRNEGSLRRDGSKAEDIKMASALQELITTLKDPSNNGRRVWTPATLKNMSSWQQQDAQEYFSGLLGAIDKEYVATAKLSRTSGLEQVNISNNTGEKAPKTQTLPPNPLTGLTATRVVCTKCGYSEGLKTTPSLCQPLIVGEGREYDLSQLLREGSKLDFVNGLPNQKQDVIARPPKSLALHLNRSTYGPDGELTKKTAAIRFPKYLDLGPYCLGSTGGSEENPSEEWLLGPYSSMVAGIQQKSRVQGPLYELRAVITHSGRHENGHYICYRKHPIPDTKTDENGNKRDQWWRLSDDHVMKVSEENVLAQGGVFMLFYDQIEPAVPSPPTTQDGVTESRASISPSEITEDHDDREAIASELSDADEDVEQGEEEKYSPTKAILIPQADLGSRKKDRERDSCEGVKEGGMGGLVMV